MAYTAQDYGFVTSFLNKYPDVRTLVNNAIKKNTTPERFALEFQNSKWYRDRSEAQRQYDTLLYNDPAEAKKRLAARKSELWRLAQQMGLTYTTATLDAWALSSTRSGIEPDDMRAVMAGAAGAISDKQITGTASGAVNEAVTALRKTAADYGVPTSTSTLLTQVRAIVGGSQNIEGYQDQYREQAKKQYAAVADQLDAGMTLRQVANPYLDIAANELGVAPETMELTDPRWTAMFANGQIQSYEDWQQTIRSGEKYGWDKTAKARDESMKAMLGLGRVFGTVG